MMPKRKQRPPRAKPVEGDATDATLTSKGNERVFGNHVIGLVRRAWGLPTSQPFARPSQGVIDGHDGDRGNTPNQRGLARIWDYGSAMAQDEGILGHEPKAARARLIDFFTKQRAQEGHQYAEGNTSSHGPLWLLIGASAHALALHYHDEAVLEVTGEWWRCQAALDDVLPEGFIAMHAPAAAPRAQIAKNGDVPEALVLDDGFDRAWRRVGLALDRVGFTVEDRDRSKGLYYVRYVDPDLDGTGNSDSAWSKLAFWRSDDDKKNEQYRISVADSDKGSEVRVQNAEGQSAKSPTAGRILALLQEELK